jgi:hypothetical protein
VLYFLKLSKSTQAEEGITRIDRTSYICFGNKGLHSLFFSLSSLLPKDIY